MNIKKLLYAKTLAARRRLAERALAETSALVTRQQRELFQVAQFNRVWKCACGNVPFYKAWRDKYSLPEAIGSLAELESWPVLTKDDLRKNELFVRTDVSKPKGRIITGGSTGTPIRLPAWFDNMAGVSQMIGRARYGVSTADRIFLLWGHEHLYGVGFKRIVNIFKRRFKDWLADWERVSAYDLSHDAMIDAYGKLMAFEPSVVIAYSPAILSFCRQNSDKKGLIKSVRTVICSAGPLSWDERLEVSRFFSNATICMEYGTVECGIIAYTRPQDSVYEIFWNTHLVQAQKDANGEVKAIVTRLTDCYVPLIRYDVGDYLEMQSDNEDEKASVFEVKDVKGRPTELLKFSCGVEFFAWTVGDCVKQVPRLVSHQVAVDEGNNRMEIRVTAEDKLTDDELALPIDRLSRIIENCNKINVSVVQVEKLYTTVGGKTPRVVRL